MRHFGGGSHSIPPRGGGTFGCSLYRAPIVCARATTPRRQAPDGKDRKKGGKGPPTRTAMATGKGGRLTRPHRPHRRGTSPTSPSASGREDNEPEDDTEEKPDEQELKSDEASSGDPGAPKSPGKGKPASSPTQAKTHHVRRTGQDERNPDAGTAHAVTYNAAARRKAFLLISAESHAAEQQGRPTQSGGQTL